MEKKGMRRGFAMFVVLGSFTALAPSCSKLSKNCEYLLTCVEYDDGAGGAEGDGDGDTGGTGEGDGDTGGMMGPGGASSGGTGGTPLPCDGLCGGDTAYCEETSNECVGCLEDDHCLDGVCDEDNGNVCVGCLEAADCVTPELPTCGEENTCDAGCTSNDDCTRFGDEARVCDLESGECVECTPETDDRTATDDACGVGVCSPETLECEDGLQQASKDVCSACIADNECLVGQNCIPLSYVPDGEPEVELGGFCMKLAPGCSPPYQAGAINRQSLSGAPATNYCGLAEEFATCAAIKDLEDGKPCTMADQCGSGSGEGRCEIVNLGSGLQCTYSCSGANAECPTAFPCEGTVGDEYCGG